MTTPPPPSSGGPPSLPPGQPGPPGYAPPGRPGPPGYAAPGHPPPYHYPPPYPRGTNTMAILALVFAFVFAPVAIVLGHMARKQIQQTGEEGDTLALIGMIVGYVSTGLLVCACLGYAVFAMTILGTVGLSSV